MAKCKNCQSKEIIKNGFVRDRQRFHCKKCGYNFILGDQRTRQSTQIKKSLAVILYSSGGTSLRFISKLLSTQVSLIYRWVRNEGRLIDDPIVDSDIKEIEIDEMWHFIKSKKTKGGFSKPWIVRVGELSPGLSVIVALRQSKDSTRS